MPITDEKSLKTWLEGRPREDAQAIATRAAQRAFPRLGRVMESDWVRERDLTALPILRLDLTSGVKRKYPTRKVRAAATWTALDADANLLAQNQDPATTPLWHGSPPDWFTQAAAKTRAIWAADPPGRWDFWLRWWDGILAGTPLDWDLQRDIALIPDADWQQGPDHIARLIAGIELDHAIAATPNAEVVSINPATGLLRTDPISALPSGHLADTLDRLRDAQTIFGGSGGGNDPYGTILPERQLIDDALSRYTTRPRMLFSVCGRVERRISAKIADGACPKEDALVEDYLGEMLAVRSRLLSFDPEVRDAVEAEASFGSLIPTSAQATIIVQGTTAIADLAEGDLKIEMPADAQIIADPDTTAKEKGEAFYIIASRTLRIAALTSGKSVAKAYKAARAGLSATAGVSKDLGVVGATLGLPAAYATGWLDPVLKVILDVLARF